MLGKRKLPFEIAEDELRDIQYSIKYLQENVIAPAQKRLREAKEKEVVLLKKAEKYAGWEPFDIFSSLPQELRLQVLGYLHWRDINICLKVCKTWRESTAEMIHYLYKTRGKGPCISKLTGNVTKKIQTRIYEGLSHSIIDNKYWSVFIKGTTVKTIVLPKGLNEFGISNSNPMKTIDLNGLSSLFYRSKRYRRAWEPFVEFKGAHNVRRLWLRNMSIFEDELNSFCSVETFIFYTVHFTSINNPLPATAKRALFIGCTFETAKIFAGLDEIVMITCRFQFDGNFIVPDAVNRICKGKNIRYPSMFLNSPKNDPSRLDEKRVIHNYSEMREAPIEEDVIESLQRLVDSFFIGSNKKLVLEEHNGVLVTKTIYNVGNLIK